MITITVWHNPAADGQGRLIAMLDGYQPGHPMVRVFAYQADPAGLSRRRSPKRRSLSATATPATPAARTCPAAITHASCGRDDFPEDPRVVARHVASAAGSCGRSCGRDGAGNAEGATEITEMKTVTAAGAGDCPGG
jgi:hypothetical protein